MDTDNERPRDYTHSKIYEIRPRVGGQDHERYFGSTTKKYLSTRFSWHKSDYKKWKEGKRSSKVSVFDLFDKYTFEGCEIVLLETVKCNSKDEMLMREKYHIQNNLCVNKVLPLRTHKEYYELHKAEQSDRFKVYYEENKEHLNKRNKQWRENNAEQLRKKNAERYDPTKRNASYKADKENQILCECGLKYTPYTKNVHSKRQHHLKFFAAETTIYKINAEKLEPSSPSL